MYLFIYLPIY